MCRSSTTTMGSRVVSITTPSGAGSLACSTTGTFSFTASATAVPLFGAVEVPEPGAERHEGPDDRVQPRVARVLSVRPDLLSGLVRRRQVITVAVEQRGPDEFDVDRAGVQLEQLADPGIAVVRELLPHLGDHEEDAGEIEPGPHDERQQLLDVADERAHPGKDQADPDIEDDLQGQCRHH